MSQINTIKMAFLNICGTVMSLKDPNVVNTATRKRVAIVLANYVQAGQLCTGGPLARLCRSRRQFDYRKQRKPSYKRWENSDREATSHRRDAQGRTR
jgi:hypothetical protein